MRECYMECCNLRKISKVMLLLLQIQTKFNVNTVRNGFTKQLFQDTSKININKKILLLFANIVIHSIRMKHH